MAALIAVAAIAVFLLILLAASVRVAREYERGVIFRLGRLKSPPKGPGLFLLIPIVDKMVSVDLRTVTLNVPPQEVITKDNVPVRVNAVAYFRIIDPEKAIVQIENFMVATSQIAQTTLRSVLGQHTLDELLSERDKINAILQQIIDEATSPWGIKVSIVEVKDVEIPTGMQRAMARQAEAERERRAKVIAAEGRVPGLRAVEGRRSGALREPDVPPAPLPADDARDQLRALLDDHPSGADRPLHAVHRGDPASRRDDDLTPDLRRDPISGRTVAIAPARARRPGVDHPTIPEPTQAELDECPFCEGREDRTPPETYALGPPGGCRTRPAGRFASSRTSTRRSSGRRSSCTRRGTPVRWPSWRRARPRPSRRSCTRAARLRPAEGFAYVQVVLNEGRVAGSSLPHSHSQLFWLREPPPAVLEELPRLRTRAAAASATCLREERLEIALRGDVVALAAPAGRAPTSSCSHRAGTPPSRARRTSSTRPSSFAMRSAGYAEPKARSTQRLAAHGRALAHRARAPRLTVFAGLELGAGIYVNSLPPEEAAQRLRA